MPNAYYLKLGSGGEHILGESRDRHHMGWIKLESFWMGDSSKPNGATGTGSGKATSSEVMVAKRTDRTSTDLHMAANDGRMFKSAVIEIADQKSGVPKLRLTLTDVTADNFSVNGNGGFSGGSSDTFKLNFANAEWNHNPLPEESVGDILQTALQSFGLAPAHGQ